MIKANEARKIVAQTEARKAAERANLVKGFCINDASYAIKKAAEKGHFQVLINCEQLKGYEQDIADYLFAEGGFDVDCSCSGYVTVNWAE